MENSSVSRPQMVKLWDSTIVKNLHKDYSDQYLKEKTVTASNWSAHEANQRRST